MPFFGCNECGKNTPPNARPLAIQLRRGEPMYVCPVCDAAYHGGMGNLPHFKRDAPLVALVDGEPITIPLKDGALYASKGHGVYLLDQWNNLGIVKQWWEGGKKYTEDTNQNMRNLRMEFAQYLALRGHLAELKESPHGRSEHTIVEASRLDDLHDDGAKTLHADRLLREGEGGE